MANLSFEIINYGCVPQFATVRRVVFVNNISQHTLSFFWELESQNFSKVRTRYISPGFIEGIGYDHHNREGQTILRLLWCCLREKPAITFSIFANHHGIKNNILNVTSSGKTHLLRFIVYMSL